MNPNAPSDAGAAIIEAVESQLKENNPPKVRQTLDRLMGLGMPRDDAVKYIASALSVEIFGAIRNSEAFDSQRYDGNLEKLPEQPWENS
ncbi:hypothetical protein [Motiliproteus sp. SC1-56]|uniref:hypothetical protein n=1 Tax=Motiliproteus sp. SC1-56 TaxID=2799565 RepID=UPI001A90471D|nr:hypothetical protein [Motiliproteus sp. SC1-56]